MVKAKDLLIEILDVLYGFSDDSTSLGIILDYIENSTGVFTKKEKKIWNQKFNHKIQNRD